MTDHGIIFLRRKHHHPPIPVIIYSYYRKYAVLLFLGHPVIYIYIYIYMIYMKSFIAKCVISILVNLRYFRTFKLLKYKENNKKICNTFDHNFKNIPLYIMSNVSLERYYFVLYDGALTLKMSKMALNVFCDKTLHIYIYIHWALKETYHLFRVLPTEMQSINMNHIWTQIR